MIKNQLCCATHGFGDLGREIFLLHVDAFADFHPSEGDEFTALSLDRFAHGDGVVQDKLLILQAHFFVKLIHATGENFFHDIRGLSAAFGLRAIHRHLALVHVVRHAIAAQIRRRARDDVHRELIREIHAHALRDDARRLSSDARRQRTVHVRPDHLLRSRRRRVRRRPPHPHVLSHAHRRHPRHLPQRLPARRSHRSQPFLAQLRHPSIDDRPAFARERRVLVQPRRRRRRRRSRQRPKRLVPRHEIRLRVHLRDRARPRAVRARRRRAHDAVRGRAVRFFRRRRESARAKMIERGFGVVIVRGERVFDVHDRRARALAKAFDGAELIGARGGRERAAKRDERAHGTRDRVCGEAKDSNVTISLHVRRSRRPSTRVVGRVVFSDRATRPGR